jgi:excisionase family DNA binding protein
MRRLLDIVEASAYLDCHRRTVLRMIRNGRLPAYHLGRSLKIRPEDLDRALIPMAPQHWGRS